MEGQNRDGNARHTSSPQTMALSLACTLIVRVYSPVQSWRGWGLAQPYPNATRVEHPARKRSLEVGRPPLQGFLYVEPLVCLLNSHDSVHGSPCTAAFTHLLRSAP